MEILLLILLLMGPCSSDDGEELFCEGDGCADVASGGGGGAAGAAPGDGGAGGSDGGSGAGGEDEPPPCECDDGDSCNGVEGCASDGSCAVIMAAHVTVDDSLCTLDYCEDGREQHPPVDIDDGDPCTVDECDPRLGPRHTPSGEPDCHLP